jgi:hypothetical protein
MEVWHTKVYYEPGRFGGWPANHGIWSWGNEVLVGFSCGYYLDRGDRHHIDPDKPEEHLLARSHNGGETWDIENPASDGYLIPQGDSLHGTELPGVEIPTPMACPGSIDFKHEDFALTTRMSSTKKGPARFLYSYDRGHRWEGPFALPDFGRSGIAARTDYLADSGAVCTLFLTATKLDDKEGRPFCCRSQDGGKNWEFLSWIGPEPNGFGIMPGSARLSESDIYVVVRRREGPRRWISAHLSEDNGKTWKDMADPVDDLGEGNPPSLVLMKDGRLSLTYGDRKEPYSMCAKLSEDSGKTWEGPFILRDDGTCKDLGYARSVQRSDGKIVTVYYFSDPEAAPDRYIGCSIFDPATV